MLKPQLYIEHIDGWADSLHRHTSTTEGRERVCLSETDKGHRGIARMLRTGRCDDGFGCRAASARLWSLIAVRPSRQSRWRDRKVASRFSYAIEQRFEPVYAHSPPPTTLDGVQIRPHCAPAGMRPSGETQAERTGLALLPARSAIGPAGNAGGNRGRPRRTAGPGAARSRDGSRRDHQDPAGDRARPAAGHLVRHGPGDPVRLAETGSGQLVPGRRRPVPASGPALALPGEAGRAGGSPRLVRGRARGRRQRPGVEEITAEASAASLPASRRTGADSCLRYLNARHEYLRYDQALAEGWPIATGVIEGACRHHRRPPRHRRGQMGPGRRRSRPHPPRSDQQRQLRRVLELPPRPRAPAPLSRHQAGEIRTRRLSGYLTPAELHLIRTFAP